jgi:intracellular multiplication protein IcmO
MQFTRSLQSLADEYGYIFKAQLADVDVLDVVLNRRILIALIPALEKSGDEAANLGKIISASLKGMMGSTLGNTVDGSWENAISSKQTYSLSSFMTVFDEVGYYTAPGMAVMAAQARSLGFSLIFAAQDLPSMEKRVKQEAQSILGNCKLKIFGKIEDPMDTKKFFSEHVGTDWVVEAKGLSAPTSTVSSLFMTLPFYDDRTGGGPTSRARAGHKDLRKQREGQAVMLFAEYIVAGRLFHAVADKVKALRVQKLLPMPASTTATAGRDRAIRELATRMQDPAWTAETAVSAVPTAPELAAMASALAAALAKGAGPLRAGAAALGALAAKADETMAAQAARDAASPQKASPMGRGAGRLLTQAASAIRLPLASDLPLREGDEFEPLAWDETTVAALQDSGATASPAARADERLNPDTNLAAMRPPFAIDATLPPLAITEVDEGPEVLQTPLSHDVKSLLENLAGRLNEGLSDARKDG